MNLTDARLLAHKLMAQHRLDVQGWTFDFDNAKKRLGAAHFHKRKITISKYMTQEADEELVRQTLLHEIAHALLPYHVKHGREWKELAKKIGYTGERTARNPYAEKNEPSTVLVKKVSKGSGISTGDVVKFPNGLVLTMTGMARTRMRAIDEKTGKRYAINMEAFESLTA